MDRNLCFVALKGQVRQSLSARRAWIEIDSAVDSASGTLSLSARRAWIEIVLHGLQGLFVSGRSPQGERG